MPKSMIESSSPHEWGLPPKFSKWRPGQAKAVEHIIDCDKRFSAHCQPAGTGKSPTYVSAAVIGGYRAAILTSTVGLQTQLNKDFESIGMATIMGKGRYQCTDKMGTCEESWPVCKTRIYDPAGCPWKSAHDKACRAPLVNTNYACWLARNKAARNGVGAFTQTGPDEEAKPFDMLILDEAHEASEELSKFMAVELSNEDIERVIKSTLPEKDQGMTQWCDWAGKYLPGVKARVQEYEAGIAAQMTYDEKELKTYSKLLRLKDGLGTLASCKPDMWVVEAGRYGWKFDPVWPGNYAKNLFQSVPRVVFMSATLRPMTMHLNGLKDDDFRFHEYDSPFKIEDSPIYHVATARWTNKSSPDDIKAIHSRSDQIIRQRLDRRGIIQSVSYERALEIKKMSEFKGHMILNSNAHDGMKTSEAVKKYIAARPPAILVSPSVSTGYDFAGTHCEYNIIPKVPFPDSRSAVMIERTKRNPDYGMYLAAQKLVQSCGRGNRFIGDRCQTFILDDSIKWFVYRYRRLFPKYFYRFFKSVEVIPPPLVKMTD